MPGAGLGAYPGYVDPALPDGEAQEEYWGSNYARLQEIKRKYDPGDLFHNPQVCITREPSRLFALTYTVTERSTCMSVKL